MKFSRQIRTIIVVVVLAPIVFTASYGVAANQYFIHETSKLSEPSIVQDTLPNNTDIYYIFDTEEKELVQWDDDDNSSTAGIDSNKFELDICTLSLLRTSSYKNIDAVVNILNSLPLPDDRFILEHIEIEEISVLEGVSTSNKLTICYGHEVDSWDEMNQQSQMWRTFYKTFTLMFALVDDLDEISIVFHRANGIPGPGGGIDVAHLSDESAWMLGITDWDAFWVDDCLSADAVRKSFEYINSRQTPYVEKVDCSEFPWNCFYF